MTAPKAKATTASSRGEMFALWNLASRTKKRRSAASATTAIEKARRQACFVRLAGCCGRGGSSCSITLPPRSRLGRESQVKAELGRTLDSLSSQLAADATPASHPRQTLANSGFRQWLGDHATIGSAAACGNPPRRHELWRAVRDRAREQLAPDRV